MENTFRRIGSKRFVGFSNWFGQKKKKPLVAVVWKKIKKMIKHCQWTMNKKVKYFIHMETVKTETTQTKYQLLQVYMDQASIINHAWLWKQMVTFFVHTQKKKSEKPKYQLNKKKKMHLKKWWIEHG